MRSSEARRSHCSAFGSTAEEPVHAPPTTHATRSCTRLKATMAADQYDQCRGRTAAATASRVTTTQAGASAASRAVTTPSIPHARAVPSMMSPAPPPIRPHAQPVPAVVLHHCEATQNPARTAPVDIECRIGAPSATPSTLSATAATARGQDSQSLAISYARRARARTTVGYRSEFTPCIGALTPSRDAEKLPLDAYALEPQRVPNDRHRTQTHRGRG